MNQKYTYKQSNYEIVPKLYFFFFVLERNKYKKSLRDRTRMQLSYVVFKRTPYQNLWAVYLMGNITETCLHKTLIILVVKLKEPIIKLNIPENRKILLSIISNITFNIHRLEKMTILSTFLNNYDLKKKTTSVFPSDILPSFNFIKSQKPKLSGVRSA